MENSFHRREFSSTSRGRFTLENSVHRGKPGSPRRIQFSVKNRETGEPRLSIRCSPEIDIRGWIEGNGGKMIARDRYRESGPILEPPRENRFPWSSYLKSGIPVRALTERCGCLVIEPRPATLRYSVQLRPSSGPSSEASAPLPVSRRPARQFIKL